MATTAVREIHRDSEPLFTGTHKLATYANPILEEEGSDALVLDEDGEAITEEDSPGGASLYLYDKGAMFRSLGVDPDLELYIENETQGTGGTVTAADENTVTASGVYWFYGDTYNIYKTGTKDGYISAVWTDVSRGFKINHPGEVNKQGWRKDDWDIDDRGRKRIFGPGQPEAS